MASKETTETEEVNTSGTATETSTTAETTAEENTVDSGVTVTYTKKAILGSRKYSEYRDILDVLLSDSLVYTESEIGIKISEFMKGQVN